MFHITSPGKFFVSVGAGKMSVVAGLPPDQTANYCRICVSDNGMGFDDKFSSSIFNLFEKLNPKASFEGSGIGLAIAKKIIDRHHGFIIAKSVLGEGSAFSVILPFKQPRS